MTAQSVVPIAPVLASTKTAGPPDLKETYANFVWKPKPARDLGQAFNLSPQRVSGLKIRVNGQAYGTIQGLMNELLDGLRELEIPYSCTSHGDEHARNIMVYTTPSLRGTRRDGCWWIT